LNYYNFIILIPIFPASDFIKEKFFLILINLNNGIKIYWLIVPPLRRFLIAESEDMEVFILSAEVIK